MKWLSMGNLIAAATVFVGFNEQMGRDPPGWGRRVGNGPLEAAPRPPPARAVGQARRT